MLKEFISDNNITLEDLFEYKEKYEKTNIKIFNFEIKFDITLIKSFGNYDENFEETYNYISNNYEILKNIPIKKIIEDFKYKYLKTPKTSISRIYVGNKRDFYIETDNIMKYISNGILMVWVYVMDNSFI